MDVNTNLTLKKIKQYLIIKNFLSYLCYGVILIGILVYFSHFFQKKNTIKIISDFSNNQQDYRTEKVMTNPRIVMQYNHDEIYNIIAKKAFHKSEKEIILNDVYAEGSIGKISAGELKISEDANEMVFTKNPILILNNNSK